MEAKKLKNEEKKETKVIDFKTKKGVTVYASKEEAVKGLKKWDVANINKRLKQAYIAEKDADAKSTLLEAENKVKLKEIENQRKEMQAEKDVLYFQYSNTSIKNKMARLNRFTDFTSTINEQTKKEIKDLEKKGKKFSRNSMACSILSALTSCFGLYAIEGGTNIMFFVSCIFMVVISTYNNHIINNIVTITSKFKKNDSVSNVLVSMMYAVCGIIISYSVYTNFQFWSAIQKSLFAASIYSVVFDATSIVFALMSNMYKTLDFNSKYIESMKDLDIEIETENSQLKNSQSEIENNKIEIENSPVEIEKLKTEIENNRIEIENYKLQIEKLKTETEKSPVEIEKLKIEIEKLKTETENTIENKLKQIENAIENGNDFNSISTQSQFQLNLANRYNAELLGLLSSNLNLISVQFQLEGAKKYDVIDTEKGQVEIETRLKNTTRKIEIEKSEIENDEIIIENSPIEIENPKIETEKIETEIEKSQSKIEIEKSKLKNQELKLKTENKKLKSKSKKSKTETVESKAMTKVEKSIRKMILKMEDNERVKAKDIKDTFGLTSNEWADIRNNLVEDGLLYTKGSNAYKTAQKMGTI